MGNQGGAYRLALLAGQVGRLDRLPSPSPSPLTRSFIRVNRALRRNRCILLRFEGKLLAREQYSAPLIPELL